MVNDGLERKCKKVVAELIFVLVFPCKKSGKSRLTSLADTNWRYIYINDLINVLMQ
jgi:hypothetical protein